MYCIGSDYPDWRWYRFEFFCLIYFIITNLTFIKCAAHKRNPRTTSCNVALECEHLSCFVRVVSEPPSNFHLRQRQICIHHNNRVISFFLIFRLQIKLLLVRSWLQVSRLPFIPFLHCFECINSIECHKVLVHVL